MTGPLIERYGLPATGFVAMLVALPPLLMVAAMRINHSALSAKQQGPS